LSVNQTKLFPMTDKQKLDAVLLLLGSNLNIAPEPISKRITFKDRCKIQAENHSKHQSVRLHKLLN